MEDAEAKEETEAMEETETVVAEAESIIVVWSIGKAKGWNLWRWHAHLSPRTLCPFWEKVLAHILA